MGKIGHAVGMLLCIILAILSHFFSEEINALFVIDVDQEDEMSAPLVGLQLNESWFVVMVEFESSPLQENAKITTGNQLEEYAQEYL